MPSRKLITRVLDSVFHPALRTHQLHPIPASLVAYSNSSNPFTDSPHITTFDNIIWKVFKKTLKTSLISNDAALKEVHNCIPNNNEERFKRINPYIHAYWRDLHVRSGCVCIDEKIAIPIVLWKTLLKTYMLVTRVWYVWPLINGGHSWIGNW